MTLTEFLLARIAEDEAAASDQLAKDMGLEKDYRVDGDINYPDAIAVGVGRWLAECDAKRRIVDVWIAQWSIAEDGHPSRPLGGEGGEVYYEVLCHLAAIYADYPDYQQDWRP